MEIKNRKDKINTKLSILNTLEDEDITRNQNEVDINLIDYNDKNFYGSIDNDDDIRELADSIKEVGLLHNIVVKPTESGRFVLISGEKRTKAYRLLYKETNDSKWKKIPCKMRDDIKNNIDEEIMIIKANRDVRERSETVKAKEVERLENLYESKKASGEKVGTIRKRIANDLGMSETQVQRYKKVNELIPEFKEMLDNGEITIAATEHFASFEPDIQKSIYDSLVQKGQKISREEAKEIRDETQSLVDSLKSANENLQKQVEESNNEKVKAKEQLESFLSEKEVLSNKIRELEDSRENKDTDEVEKINQELESYKNRFRAVEEENLELLIQLEEKELSHKQLIEKVKVDGKKEKAKAEKPDQKKSSDTKDKQFVEDIKLELELNLHIKKAYEAVKTMSGKIEESVSKKKMLSEENEEVLRQIREAIEAINI